MKTILIKLSGKKIDEIMKESDFIGTIKNFAGRDNRVIIVHGGGKQITQWADKLGIESKFLNGQRITGKEMIEVVAAVQAGLLNKKIVSLFIKHGIMALGVSGVDGNSFRAEISDSKLGFVGKPKKTGSVDWLDKLLSLGFMPVFSSICMDSEGNLINVNADYFVEEIAKELNIDEVYYFSDISGVLIKGNKQSKLDSTEIEYWIKNGEITDGMIPKVNSALSLTKHGVSKIWIGSDLSMIDNNLTGGTEIVAA